jgi:hypothetical protein
MNRPHQRVYQGVRSNRYSGSKLTNWTDFHPWHSAVSKAFFQHRPYLRKEGESPLLVLEPTHGDFLQPLSREDIKDTLLKVPGAYTRGLQGVFLLSGSAKLSKVARSLYCYGTYWLHCVFLAPFPKIMQDSCYMRPPKPSILREWIRSGAEVQQTPDGLRVRCDGQAIRRFYIRDVLLHEIGHHVDRHWMKPNRKKEGFAEWFATEYGFRMRRDD